MEAIDAPDPACLGNAEPTAVDGLATVPTRGKIVRNAVLLGGGESGARLISVLATLVIGHVLGPAAFGSFSLAQSFALYFALLSDGGLTVWTQRQIAARRNEASELISDTLTVQLVLAGIAVLGLVVLAIVLPLPAQTKRLILIVSPFMITQALTTLYALQALERMGAAVTARVLAQVVTAVFGVVAVVITHSAALAVTALWVGQGAGALSALGALRRVVGLRRPTFSAPRLTPMLRGGAPLLGASAAFQFVSISAILTLSILRSPTAVGVFSAALRLLALGPTVLVAVYAALLPEMVRRLHRGVSYLADFTRASAPAIVRISLFAAIIISAQSHWIVRVIYGARYQAAGDVLTVAAALLPAYAFSLLITQIIVAVDRNADLIKAYVIAAVSAAVALPLATALGDVVGATLALTGVTYLLCAILAIYLSRVIGGSWLVSLVPELIWGAVAFAATLAVRQAVGSVPLTFAAWGIVVIVVEIVRGGPTFRFVLPSTKMRDSPAPARHRAR